MASSSPPTLREWLAREPFSLALSAGFFGFFAHTGALRALSDAGLRPVRVVGASAGALVGGLWAGGVEADAMADELVRLKREDFWDPAPGFGLLRGDRFRDKVRAMLLHTTFESARVPAALSVWDVKERTTRVRSTGSLDGAICASCAFPGMFQPVWLDDRPLLDGGIADRPGHAGLAAGERVLFHHLPSKSPWRREAPPIPSRTNMVTIATTGFPRLGPFRLERGPDAIRLAKQATERALNLPADRVIAIEATG